MKNMGDIEIYQEFYYELKDKYPDCILLFFLDDCGQYVAYNKDAETLAKILDEPHTEIKLDENLWIPAIYIGSALLDRVIQKAVRSGKRVVLKENYEQTIENEEMETKREIKTIFDLKKGDTVIGGVFRVGHGFIKGMGYAEELTVQKIEVICDRYGTWFTKPIRLTRDNDVILSDNLFEAAIYSSYADYQNGTPINTCQISYASEIAKKLNCESTDDCLFAWKWNKLKNEATKDKVIGWVMDLMDLKLPEGCYATKEECEKANKKMVKIEITQTYVAEVDEEEAGNIIKDPACYDYPLSDMVSVETQILN